MFKSQKRTSISLRLAQSDEPKKRSQSTRKKHIISPKKLRYSEGKSDSEQDDDYTDSDRTPFSNKSNNAAIKRTPGMGLVFTSKKFAAPTFLSGTRPIGCKQGGSQLGVTRRNNRIPTALYDPNAEGAFILYSPPEPELDPISLASVLLTSATLNEPKAVVEIHVLVDPLLSKILRPHQIEGVRFLYECVTGNKQDDCFGCIMADEMGLGKTLQCIALLWTLLKQSPIPGSPTIEKAVIVCPSSLVNNWAQELQKWLPNRIQAYACDNKGKREETLSSLLSFTNAKGRSVTHPVLIISYETLRLHSGTIQNTEIGLMLCDEGHRLKNSANQTYRMLSGLNVKRRVILSGTPVQVSRVIIDIAQNDLSEYFSLLNFANPGLLGTDSEFRKKYENPIERGRDSMASDADKKKSEETMKVFLEIGNKFMIRRTAALLTKYLPTKYEHVVFCKLAPLQTQIYHAFVESKAVKSMMEDDDKKGKNPLQSITILKKLCNHPALTMKQEEGSSRSNGSNSRGSKKQARDNLIGDVNIDLFPDDFDFNGLQSKYSGKMKLLELMLLKIRKETDDKIVLISNYTQTLLLFENMCRQRQWGCLRLDGGLNIRKRMQLVDEFNKPESTAFVFLLSSKAGGCGLNLVGANRLILFDPDWNPANDGQALARIWRDGQKKICFIYRFIATGSIEEKIFQRQAHKNALSSSVVDEELDVERHFSSENLRQLFSLNTDTTCDTHDTFACKRCVKGRQIKGPNIGGTGASASDTSTWNHYSELDSEFSKVHDNVLRDCGKGLVSFVFQNKSHDAKVP